METATPSRSAYQVRTPAFEGPFGLLLELIEKRKLSVSEVSLSQVTDDFIQHVKSQAEFPIEDAADFIQVAATLLLIKSKSLIPDLELSEEEETDIDELKRRLEMYERAREAAKVLGRLFGESVMVPAGERMPDPIFSPAKDLTLAHIERALRTALAELEKEEQLPETRVRPMVTIEEMMDRLMNRVQKALTMSFSEISGSGRERTEVIVSFLALLELVKQGAVDVLQHQNFSDIRITNTSATTPTYG
ncbi:segregation/condensation protein A [Candidatus Parcubacteria bacterium]|nr:segregation/condensation protein A [Candidatus Parcubacteria bacterium]